MPPEKITIDASKLPEGMTAEKLIELLASAEARNASGAKQRKVRSYAVQHLTDAHKAEYEKFRKEAEELIKAKKL